MLAVFSGDGHYVPVSGKTSHAQRFDFFRGIFRNPRPPH